MWEILAELPLSYAVLGAATLGLAPFSPEPLLFDIDTCSSGQSWDALG